MNLKELEGLLLNHCYDMTILKKNAPLKKKDSILDALISAIIRSETPFEDVALCICDVNNNNVIDLKFFDFGGNIEDYINPKWMKFSKALWRQRSVGLGTPNAASGEGELMFIFLSPSIEKPTRGDLSINGKYVELKGEGVRVNGKISGKEFRNLTIGLCRRYELTPNIANRTGIEAVEIEKSTHEQHWDNELGRLDIENRKNFISEYLGFIDNNEHNVDNIFHDSQLNFDDLRKRIVKILYNSMINDRSFDKFIILGDGSNVKILNSDIEMFNESINNGGIKIESDYFRINQNANIGWYIS